MASGCSYYLRKQYLCQQLYWPPFVGVKQIDISDRLLALENSVSISATPGHGNAIALWNTGKANLYMWGFDMPNNNIRYERERLISPSQVSNYWIPVPNIGNISTTTRFEFKLYLTDEYGNKWISENGGEATPKTIFENGKSISTHETLVWSYKTHQTDWQMN